jgi:hypothetical protein
MQHERLGTPRSDRCAGSAVAPSGAARVARFEKPAAGQSGAGKKER